MFTISGLYPLDPSDLPKMKSAVEKVSMNDPAVDIQMESCGAFGQGWRLGFLGK